MSIQIAEIECAECGDTLAHIQVLPGIILAHGEAWCPDCFAAMEDEEEDEEVEELDFEDDTPDEVNTDE